MHHPVRINVNCMSAVFSLGLVSFSSPADKYQLHVCDYLTQLGCLGITSQKAVTSLVLSSSLPAWVSFAAGTVKTLLATARLSFHHQPESININVIIIIIIITSLVVFCCRHRQNPASQGCCRRGRRPLLLQVSLHTSFVLSHPAYDCSAAAENKLAPQCTMVFVPCTQVLGSMQIFCCLRLSAFCLPSVSMWLVQCCFIFMCLALASQ